jgi:hypothetical protein
MARIFYPAKFDEQVELINRIIRKHSADGMQSELSDFNIGVLKLKADTALQNHSRAKEHEKITGYFIEQRDKDIKSVMSQVRQLGAFLKAKYRNNIDELINWGFSVAHTSESINQTSSHIIIKEKLLQNNI